MSIHYIRVLVPIYEYHQETFLPWKRVLSCGCDDPVTSALCLHLRYTAVCIMCLRLFDENRRDTTSKRQSICIIILWYSGLKSSRGRVTSASATCKYCANSWDWCIIRIDVDVYIDANHLFCFNKNNLAIYPSLNDILRMWIASLVLIFFSFLYFISNGVVEKILY